MDKKEKHVTVETRKYLRIAGKKLDTRYFYDEIIERKGYFITVKDGLYGLVSPEGRPILQRKFRRIDIIDDYVLVTDKKGLEGLRDLHGTVIFPCLFKSLIIFNRSEDGLVQIQLPGSSLWGFASIPERKVVLEPKYARVTEFHGKYCAAGHTNNCLDNYACLLDHEFNEIYDFSLAPEELENCFNKPARE